MKKPYIKLLEKVAGFKVYEVDGTYVRGKINEEFTNFGEYYLFKFIPKDEFWIDRERAPGETNFFVEHLLLENRLMREGKNRRRAVDLAEEAERKERAKTKLAKKIKKYKGGEAAKAAHKKLLKEYSRPGGVQVWVVRGEMVRDRFYVDFTEGGHDLVYSFVPKGEVWLDDDLSIKERGFVLLHELHERGLMVRGRGYEEAHKSASRIEYECRKKPERLEKEIEKEIKKNLKSGR